ncbi:alpha/beta fold hydrolase [Pseudonocardia sp. NPDC049154]|uniref:alpha/beta fold hydrolase n=1 Tax=Pseudonocardia sp. NPDC049154 TaxID=3155501 RepID=UPI0033FF7D5C
MSFVLVHGAGYGASCWDELVPLLEHDTLAVDLPGRGSRAGTDLIARVMTALGGRIRRVVLLSAVVPPDGTRVLDQIAPGVRLPTEPATLLNRLHG